MAFGYYDPDAKVPEDYGYIIDVSVDGRFIFLDVKMDFDGRMYVETDEIEAQCDPGEGTCRERPEATRAALDACARALRQDGDNTLQRDAAILLAKADEIAWELNHGPDAKAREQDHRDHLRDLKEDR
jgi:hypothetical protein